jgi:hypothetical protein
MSRDALEHLGSGLQTLTGPVMEMMRMVRMMRMIRMMRVWRIWRMHFKTSATGIRPILQQTPRLLEP